MVLPCRCLLTRTSATCRKVATRTEQISIRQSTQSEQVQTLESPAVSHRRVFRLNKPTKKEEYPLSEALRALRAYSLSARPETVDLAIKVDMTLKKDKVRDAFRGTLIYPHKFGHHRKILLIADETSVPEVATSGADIIGGPDHIKQLEEGTLNISKIDVCICTTGVFNKLKPLHKILRAKMPTPRRGTVVDLPEIYETVLNCQQSRQYQSDKRGHIHIAVGTLDFPDEDILTNMKSLLEKVASYRGSLPTASFIQRLALSSTYGPTFQLITRDYVQ